MEMTPSFGPRGPLYFHKQWNYVPDFVYRIRKAAGVGVQLR